MVRMCNIQRVAGRGGGGPLLLILFRLQTQAAQKRSGVKKVRKVNYEKQDIYDLWKLFYHKVLNNDADDIDKIAPAIDKVSSKIKKMEFENFLKNLFLAEFFFSEARFERTLT